MCLPHSFAVRGKLSNIRKNVMRGYCLRASFLSLSLETLEMKYYFKI